VRSSKFFTNCLFEVTALLIALRSGARTRASITAERSIHIHAQSVAARNGLAPWFGGMTIAASNRQAKHSVISIPDGR
jgi:hypothetical protein